MAISPEVKEQLKATIDQAENTIPELEEDIKRAELAGLDVKTAKERLRETKIRVQGLKQQFLT